MRDAKDLEKTIGEFVAEDYRTAQVFEEHGIDFCCGGKVSLAATCRERGIDANLLLEKLEQVKTAAGERAQNYAAWDLSFLADYIVNQHHGYLRETLGPLSAYARKIAEVHGPRHPEVVEIARIFDKLAADLTAHLREEEERFFPAVKRLEAAARNGRAPESGDVATLREILGQLGAEHEEVGEAVHTIRRLSGDYAVPADACNTFMLTYRMLKEFEDDLHKHVHLENNILFPKAEKL